MAEPINDASHHARQFEAHGIFPVFENLQEWFLIHNMYAIPTHIQYIKNVTATVLRNETAAVRRLDVEADRAVAPVQLLDDAHQRGRNYALPAVLLSIFK